MNEAAADALTRSRVYPALVRHYPSYKLRDIGDLTFLQIHLLLDQMIEHLRQEAGQPGEAAPRELTSGADLDAFFS